MAITFRSATTATVANGTSLVVNRPSGAIADDVAVVTIAWYNVSRSLTPPSGWTLANSVAYSASTISVYYRVLGSSEPSSYTFTFNIASSGAAVMSAFEGVDTSTPLDVAAVTASGNSATFPAPSITPVSDASMLVCCWAVGSASSLAKALAAPGSMTEAGEVEQETSVSGGFASFTSLLAYELLGAASATGTRTATGDGLSETWGAVSLALRLGNTAPNAPTLTAPIGGTTVDRTAAIDLEGTFSDPDAGDQLSAYEVEYRLQAGGGLVQPGEVSASGTTFAYTITANSLSAGGWEWRARTRDAAGALGPWSSWAQFTAASPPPTPVITDPAESGTVNTDPYTVAWTAPNQTDYQVRTVADSGGSPDTGIIYQDTGTVTSTSRSAPIDFDVNIRTEHVQVRIRFGGLWSAWDSHIVSVSYTVPPTPTAVVTADSIDGSIDIAVSNPTPTGSEPDVDSNQVQRQQSLDAGTTWTDEDGGVDAFDTVGVVVEDGTYTDRRIRHLVVYRYRVKTIGDNGTNVTGAWTS